MEVKSTDKKTFQLTEDGQLLGELIYENLFFLKAEITLSNSEQYEIAPIGFFGTSILVTKNSTEVANLKMSWRGEIVFTFQDEQEFVLKTKGIFHNKFIIENKEKEMLFQLNPSFQWSHFNYSYDITYNKKPQDILLVLLAVFAANYFIATMSGATSGLA